MAGHEILTLALGSNLGDRAGYLRRAAGMLEDAVFNGGVRRSRVYETPALLKPGSPADWNIPYYNAAICGYCTLPPQEVLARVQRIERDVGRKPRGVWAPREIDIDILLYGRYVLAEPALTVPHPLIYSRAFVLAPLADLFPGKDAGYAGAMSRLPRCELPKAVAAGFSTEKYVPA